MIGFIGRSIAAIAVVAAAFFAGSANAQLFLRQDPGGFYLGAGVGESKARGFCDDGTAAGFIGGCDEKDTAWKVTAGYRFNEYIGVEVGYVDLGKVTINGNLGGLPITGSAKTDGVEFLAVGFVPLYQALSGFAKAGGFHRETRFDAAAAGVSGSDKERGPNFTWGLGLQYAFTPNLAARLEWQRYNQIDVDTFGASVLYFFR